MIDISPNLEPSPIERDIERIGKEVAERKKSPEAKEISEKELVKEALQPIIRPAGAVPMSPAPSAPAKTTFLPNYLKDSPEEIKSEVEKLVVLVFQQGIEKTVKEARKHSDFILDAFHDALADKLYEELKKRKKI